MHGHSSSLIYILFLYLIIIGGLTCSSLNFIDDTLTAVPKYVFQPEGHLPSVNATNLRLALLPGEAVCTENLTPWLKFLPCSNTGLSQLLKATSVFASHFISIGIDVKRTCLTTSCSKVLLQKLRRFFSLKMLTISIGILT